MPRRKTGKTEISSNTIYGIWGISREYPEGAWVMDNTGNIVSSDFVGLAKAYTKLLQNSGMNVKAKMINSDGEPVELEN